MVDEYTGNLDEKPEVASPVDNKDAKAIVDTLSVDSKDADEALELVGIRRETHFSEEYNIKLRRKLDWTIPPLCAAVYFTQFLDKNSLNYMSIMGFPITGQDYNLVALAFYVGFFVWEFPTVYISQKLRLAKYLGVNVVLWGVVLMCHAIPNTFAPFFILRVILGMLESCVAPLLILIVSMFYKKNEQSRRISWFYVMVKLWRHFQSDVTHLIPEKNGLTQIFGGFVAYGISFSTTSFAPYKILVIVLGGCAVIVGISVILFLPDSPVHASFLTREERIAAIERVRDDQGGTENRRFKREQVVEALKDVRTWLVVLSTLVTSIPNGGFGNYGAIVVKSFGYTTRQTLILQTPGGLLASLATLALGWYSDKKNERMLPIILSIIPTIVGAAMLVGLNGSDQKGALLFATYIIGIYGCSLSLIYAYIASNTSGYTKKLTINALTLSAFSLANIVGSETFQPKDAPSFTPGKISILVLLSSQMGICLVLRWVNMRMNRMKAKGIKETKERLGWTEEDMNCEREKHAFLDLTDKQNPYFVYTN